MKGAGSKTFYNLGAFCSSRQWEVIFSVMTATIVLISFDDWPKERYQHEISQEYFGLYAVTMTILRFFAVLYTYKQFKTIYQLGSPFILGFAVLLVMLSSFVFFCTVIKFLNPNITELRDSFFLFFLIIDLDKASYLSRCALKSASYAEVKINIAKGLSHFGPSLTLDSISLALFIWVGTLSENIRWEQLCGYGVLIIIVNYVVLLTIYPSCISLALEMSTRCSTLGPPWLLQSVPNKAETIVANPVIQGVKKIMSAGLFVVHGIKRFSVPVVQDTLNIDEPPTIVRWINSEVENVVLFVIVIMLVTYFEIRSTNDDLTRMENEKELDFSKAVSTQTEVSVAEETNREIRTVEECLQIKSQNRLEFLTNEEVGLLLNHGNGFAHRNLETVLKDCFRAVEVRRNFIKGQTADPDAMKELPHLNYDYSKVRGRCCENVIGYMPIPVGVVGPLRIDGVEYMVPLATTEGALVASTSRGCKALNQSLNGVQTDIFKDGMTRAPMIQLPSARKAVEVQKWINTPTNFDVLKKAFDATSHYARLKAIHVVIASRLLFIRFLAPTGDAMGMNMVAKGAEAALIVLKKQFEEIEELSLSGNLCTDKKHSSINWITGRGKSIVCDAVIPGDVIKSVLKTDVSKLVDNNTKKNFIGAAMAGSIGGNNCQAANIIAAFFIACGQDPAQVVESSSCITWMECCGENKADLYISVTMPSLEVGTVGGGTSLLPQMACLRMLGVQGPSQNVPGEHAHALARIAAATVMAGELSLMACLTEHSLVKSHMLLNRVKT